MTVDQYKLKIHFSKISKPIHGVSGKDDDEDDD
jgi:hypothetical protein